MTKEIFQKIRKTKNTFGKVSTGWIQYHFKMSYQEAVNTLAEFEASIQVPFRKNGKFAKEI